MDARKATDFQCFLKNRRIKRLFLTACTAALVVLLAGCGKPHENHTPHRDNQSNQYIPPRPSATARLAADRHLYKSGLPPVCPLEPG